MTKIIPVSSVALAPLERIEIAHELDGRTGSNRARDNRPLIAAQNDIAALTAWVARYRDSPNTFSSYRKEAERLLLWSILVQNKPLSSLTHEDFLVYQHFIANPKPRHNWVMPPGRKWSRYHPDWRPFAGRLAPSSQRQTMLILNAMFSWLVSAGYLAGNPLALSRLRRLHSPPRITRLLDANVWTEVKATIESMPRESPREQEHYARARWLFALLYLSGMRISEVCHNTMGSFHYQRTREGHYRWWLEVVGKGDKTRLIPATGDLMNELVRYRLALGRTPHPDIGEQSPLLFRIDGKPQPLTRNTVHVIIKDVFARTVTRLQSANPMQESMVQELELASAHWLRHTAASNMANSMSLHHVRDNMGHSSIATTNLYLHSDNNARHKETEEKHRLNW